MPKYAGIGHEMMSLRVSICRGHKDLLPVTADRQGLQHMSQWFSISVAR